MSQLRGSSIRNATKHMWEWMDHAIGVLLNRVASMDEMVMHGPPAIFFGGLIWILETEWEWSVYLEA